MEREVLIESKNLKADSEYLKKYFKIYSFLKERQKLLRELSRKGNKENIAQIKELAQVIKKEEKKFWKQIEDEKKEGKCFLLEEIFSSFGLVLEEKRIVLYLLFLKLYDCGKERISEIVNTLDYEDEPLNKMRMFSYFSPQSRLSKHGIIKPGRRTYSTDAEYELDSIFMYFIAEALHKGELVQEFSQFSERVEVKTGDLRVPEYSLDDVIVDGRVKEDVVAFLNAYKKIKEGDTGIDIYEKIKKGKALSFLFYGPPGTGKSMLAEAIAHFLEKKVLVVEFPRITSFMFGETDKNIARIFQEGKDNDAVIVIDEADALLYSREYAEWEHDIRFVNIMLQELERFDGVVVLTTNMERLLDHALERRIALKVKFNLPDENLRYQIWRQHIPQGVVLSEDVDFNFLARRYKFSGGNIKNAVLNALRRITSEGRRELKMEDLVYGAELEEKGMISRRQRKVIKGFAEVACRIKGM